MTDTIKISRDELQRIAQGCSCEVTTDALDALLATPPADAADMGGQAVSGVPCECGCPVGYVSGERFHAEHERVRELRASIAQHRQQAGKLVEALRKIHFRADCFVEDDMDMRVPSIEAIVRIAGEALADWEKTNGN